MSNYLIINDKTGYPYQTSKAAKRHATDAAQIVKAKFYYVEVTHCGSMLHAQKRWVYKKIEAESPDHAKQIAIDQVGKSKVFETEKGVFLRNRLLVTDIGRV